MVPVTLAGASMRRQPRSGPHRPYLGGEGPRKRSVSGLLPQGLQGFWQCKLRSPMTSKPPLAGPPEPHRLGTPCPSGLKSTQQDEHCHHAHFPVEDTELTGHQDPGLSVSLRGAKPEFTPSAADSALSCFWFLPITDSFTQNT